MADFSFTALRALLKNKLGSELYSDQIDRSLRLAFEGHRGQFRHQVDGSAERIPYIVHPVGVAILAVEFLPLVKLPEKFDDVISACLVHDLLEDSAVSVSELASASSSRAANIVLALSKPRTFGKLSRRERNDQFVEQIISFGATAMFIKICDFLHNISRPNQTPPDLLKKAISRGRIDYIKFFDSGKFPDGLRMEYLRRLSTAETAKRIAKSEQEGNDNCGERSFEQAIEVCIKRSVGKVLEVHDIVESLSELVCANHCHFISIDEFISDIVEPNVRGISREKLNQIKSKLMTNEVDVAAYDGIEQSEYFDDASKIYALDLKVGPAGGDNFCVIVCLSRSRSPKWANRDTTMVLISLLGERLRTQTNLRISEIAEELAHIGLELSPGVAIKSNFSYLQFLALKSRLDAAAYVHDNIRSAINYFDKINQNKFDIERVESRIKSANSIANKVLTRRYKTIDDVDDLVGFRVICLSLTGAKAWADMFSEIVREKNSDVARMIPVIDGSLCKDDVWSSAGYVGHHIRFVVQAPFDARCEISCELQVRTIFQDAWARASQMVQYKKSARSDVKNSEIFENLSNLRDAADKEIEKLR